MIFHLSRWIQSKFEFFYRKIFLHDYQIPFRLLISSSRTSTRQDLEDKEQVQSYYANFLHKFGFHPSIISNSSYQIHLP